MPGNHCCVKTCSSTSHDTFGKLRNNGIHFFRFPKWMQHQGEQISDLTRRRRIAWLAAIRRKDLNFDRAPPSMRVCSLHFHSGKPSYEMLENHPDWAPSLRLGHNDVKETDRARYQRQVQRRTQHLKQPPPPSPAQDQQQPPSPAQDMGCGLCTSRRDVINSLMEENRKLKRELDEYRKNENFLSGDDNTVKYWLVDGQVLHPATAESLVRF